MMFSEKSTAFEEDTICELKTTKITNLNSDCLELIFERLELNDLLNIADSSKYFYGAVCQLYRRKYMNMNPIIDLPEPLNGCYGPSYRDWEMDIEETYEEWDAAFYVLEKNAEVFITEPALVFKLLRNFGHMIRNIGINFRIMNVKCCAEIENYLSKYCSESLRRLSLGFHRLRIPFEYLQKPLKSVTHLKIVIGYTEKHHIRFLDRNNLPNVSHVFILNNCRDLCDDETEANFENIDYFSMYTGYSLERFPFLFGNLKYLALFGSIHINDDILGNIERLETLKIFKLSTKSCRDSYNKLLGLKNIQSNLEEMRLGFEEHIYADDIHRFLKQSQMLRRLRLTYDLLYYRHSFPNIIRTITSNLDECWKFHVDYKYKNPYANSVKEYKTLLIDRKID